MMMSSYRPRPIIENKTHLRGDGSHPAGTFPSGIRTPRQDENLKHNHHIRLDAPDTPMDNHRRRLITERRPKPDQGSHKRPAEKIWGEKEGRRPTNSVGLY